MTGRTLATLCALHAIAGGTLVYVATLRPGWALVLGATLAAMLVIVGCVTDTDEWDEGDGGTGDDDPPRPPDPSGGLAADRDRLDSVLQENAWAIARAEEWTADAEREPAAPVGWSPYFAERRGD